MRCEVISRLSTLSVAGAFVVLALLVGCADDTARSDGTIPEASIALSDSDGNSDATVPPPEGDGQTTTGGEAPITAPTTGQPASSTTTPSPGSTTTAPGPESSAAPSSAAATTTPATPPVVDWSNVVPAEVVRELDILSGRGRTRAWLLRFDDRLTLDIAQGLALEAGQFGIEDENGALDAFADGSWIEDCDECLDPEAVGGAATLMEIMLIGGFFGDYDPDPQSPDGHELIVRTFPGQLGREPLDQREYLVGSHRLGPMTDWEDTIVDLLPELGGNEYLAAIAFEHPCGSDPAGACFQ